MSLQIAEKDQCRKFGFTMAAMIGLLFGLFFPLVFRKPFPEWPWIIAIIFAVWAILLPGTLVVIYKPWMCIGHVVGLINTKIILAVVFFLLFTPVSVILKFIGKDPMDKKINNNVNSSYWKRSQSQQKDHMDRCY